MFRHPEARGQALVEFALTLPVFILLALGLFDAGRLVIEYTTLTNASRAGARVAIVDQSNRTDCDTVRTFKCAASDQSIMMGITPGDIADVEPECTEVGCLVEVQLDHDFEMITPIIGSLIGPISLSASTTMPIERVFLSSE